MLSRVRPSRRPSQIYVVAERACGDYLPISFSLSFCLCLAISLLYPFSRESRTRVCRISKRVRNFTIEHVRHRRSCRASGERLSGRSPDIAARNGPISRNLAILCLHSSLSFPRTRYLIGQIVHVRREIYIRALNQGTPVSLGNPSSTVDARRRLFSRLLSSPLSVIKDELYTPARARAHAPARTPTHKRSEISAILRHPVPDILQRPNHP